MLKKQGNLNLVLSAEKKGPINANIQFSTQDSNSAVLYFTFSQDGQPINKQLNIHGDIYLLMEDGSSFLDEVEIVDTDKFEAKYILTDDQLQHFGIVQAEIYMLDVYGNHVSVHKFNFTIDQALVDQDIVPVAEYYVKNFNDLKAVIQQESDDLQAKIDSLEKKFTDLDNIETKQGSQAKADTALAESQIYTDQLRTEYEAHDTNTSNPHNVTKAQVGLSNVINEKQATEANFNSHSLDETNPHNVTKAQVGLSDVTNVAQASQADFDTHTGNKDIHVTAAKKTEWDSKETTQGAQTKADQAKQDAIADLTAFSWSDVTLENGFTNVDTPFQVGMDALGNVYVRGIVATGTLGTAVYTLPTDKRPTRPVSYVGLASATGFDFVKWEIGTDGTIIPIETNKTANETEYLSIDTNFIAK